jgi:hypothetical protein
VKKHRVKASYALFCVYILISKYLTRVVYSKKNNAPIFLKMIAALSGQKSIPNFQDGRSLMKLSSNFHFMMRKRKALLYDESNEMMLHAFIQPHSSVEYKKNRDAFASETESDLFCFPKYACSNDDSPFLIVFEERLPGASLEKCGAERIGDFIDVWINFSEKKHAVSQDIGLNRSIYSRLRDAALRLKHDLGSDSPFFQLYSVCGSPFEEKEGAWPVSFCHGQTLPANILYSFENNQYCFIDYEPDLMGSAPCAYDIAFFILYSYSLMSPEYKARLKNRLSGELQGHKWQKHFLAQIVWWSRERLLNPGQVRKINERSLNALSLIKSRGKIL